MVSISNLKQQKEIQKLNISQQINQINNLIPDLIIARKNGSYLNSISFNSDLINKYYDLL